MHLLTLAKNVIDSIQLEHNERRFRRSPEELLCHLKTPAFVFGPYMVYKL